MRNMSFFLTTDQVRTGIKTVTRRLGWDFVNPGDEVMACVKCQGLRKGERIERIRPIRIISAQWEPLDTITQADVIREGFPDMTPAQFVTMFCHEMGVTRSTPVNRIEFEYIDGGNQ